MLFFPVEHDGKEAYINMNRVLWFEEVSDAERPTTRVWFGMDEFIEVASSTYAFKTLLGAHLEEKA